MLYDMALCGPNRVTAGTLSGGGWSTALPLSNAESPELAAVARSLDATTTNTKLLYTAPATRLVQAIYLIGTTLSDDAQIRVSIGTTAWATDIYAGSWVDAWHRTSIDAALAAYGIEPVAIERARYPVGVFLPARTSAPFIGIEIDDTTNAAGTVDVAHVFVAGAFVSSWGPQEGIGLTMADLSGVSGADSGAVSTYRRRKQRSQAMSLIVPPEESAVLDEWRHQLGTTETLMYVASRSDPERAQLASYLCRCEEIGAIEYPYRVAHTMALRVTEWL